MGRKKAAATVMDDENPSAQAMAASKKNKKKGQKVIDDEEYGIVPEPVESEELNSAVQYAPSNGKHTTGDVQEEEDMGSVGEETALSTKKLKGKNAKKGSAEINGPPATCNVDAEEVSIPGKLKGKKAKKGFKIDDDEFDVTAFEEKSVELPQEALEQMQPKFIGKKGKKSKQDGDDESIVQGEHENGFESVDAASASKKNKKKSMEKSKGDLFSVLASYDGADDGDEDESSVVGPADVDEAEELVFTGKNKKKGSKGFKTESELDLIVADDGHSSEVLDEIVFSGKKKPKAKKGAKEKQEDEISDVQIVESGAVESGGIESEEEANVITFSGKKKGRKGKKPNQKKQDEDLESSFPETGERETLLDSDLNKALKEEDDNCIVFSGKKKPKDRRSATFTNSAFDAVLTEEEEDVPQPEVAGKPGKKAQEFSEDGGIDLNQPENEDASGIASDDAIHFTGKKKGKKNKKVLMPPEEGPVYVTMSAGDDSKTSGDSQKQEVHEPADEVSHLTDTVGASKKQKKKKKSGRTTQEEDDLDKILAELGEGPAPPKSAPVEETSKPESVEFESANVEVAASVIANGGLEAEGVVESAAAKKKKKKKEKEKEKKAAAAVPADEKTAMEVKEERPEEPKGKFADKKVPKHIREMQERLAKMKEAEEKRKREEEERLRKEEEEQRRLEELERQKEEAKRRKKEREKEKLQKKKQEGKLLSGKQKEEARRLALMREQFLGQSGLPKDEQTAAPKKPKYETKKKKRGPVSTDSGAVEQITEIVDHDNEDQTVCEFNDDQDKKDTALAEVETVEEEPQVELPKEDMEMEEDEEEEDWDAKSWDEADVALPVRSAFAEEEESSVTKRINKRVVGPVPVDTVPEKKHATATEMKPPPMKNYAAVLSAPASSSVAKPAPPVKPVSLPKEPQQVVGESGEESGSEETDSEDENAEAKRRKEVTMKRESRKAEALSKRSAADLRSPICCILGHVDTGKTKLLDCIRRTNVQEGEAGGITQQIGATYFPMDNIRERTKELKADANLRVPGLLVIDTPGHESFTNLRARGSGLCDIAILVVDIMHGLEPQTIESLNLVKMRQTPFVVALNKVDRLYGWKTRPNAPIRVALKQQSKDVQNEFEMRLSQVITELKEQGLNSELYYRNKEVRKYVSIVPTSAISGEGIPDLLMLLVQLTQKMMEERLMYVSEVQCTVLEVKVIEGLGTTIDVVLVNGVLHEGDQIVVCGMQGPIVTTIRALLTPHPMKELRVKGSYQHHKELKAAQGIKITAQGLEHAIAGTQLYVVGPDDDLEDVREEAMQDMKNVMSRIDKSGEGVCVQASTLGSLEALLEFLKSPAVNIPVSGISIGPVHKKDVMRASVMLERKKKEYATILAFDVKVTPEARELAEETGVKIFMADIIYHLFDQFKAYMDNLKEEKKREASEEAVFPCVLKIIPQCVFNKKDPIVLGVDILEGIAKVGTPLCVPSRENIDIGRIASIEVNHKAVDIAKKGQKVAMKIVGSNPEEAQKMFGRHFDLEDELVSHITRRSIDLLKENYREDLSIDEWKLVVKLKNLFKIQ